MPEDLIWIPQVLIPKLITCLYEKMRKQHVIQIFPEPMEKGCSMIFLRNFVYFYTNLDQESVCVIYYSFCFLDPKVNVDHIVNLLNKISEVEALREIFCEKVLSPVDGFVDNQRVTSNSTEVLNLISCEASNGRKIIRSVSTETTTTIEMTVTNAGSSLGEPYKPNELEQTSISRSSLKGDSKQTFLQYLMEM